MIFVRTFNKEYRKIFDFMKTNKIKLHDYPLYHEILLLFEIIFINIPDSNLGLMES